MLKHWCWTMTSTFINPVAFYVWKLAIRHFIYRQLDVKNISFYRMIISCTKIIIVVHEITPQKEISLKRNCTWLYFMQRYNNYLFIMEGGGGIILRLFYNVLFCLYTVFTVDTKTDREIKQRNKLTRMYLHSSN